MRRLVSFVAMSALGAGCVMASSATPPPAGPEPTSPPLTPGQHAHGAELGAAEVATLIVATWEVVAIDGTTCRLVDREALPTAPQLSWTCPADTPVGARILKMSDGACSLIHPRPDCGPGRICDPRPAQAVTCPGAP